MQMPSSSWSAAEHYGLQLDPAARTLIVDPTHPHSKRYQGVQEHYSVESSGPSGQRARQLLLRRQRAGHLEGGRDDLHLHRQPLALPAHSRH